MSAPVYQVAVMAKSPQPGLVKTRLCPPLSGEQAAELATAALIDTLEAVAASSAVRAVLVLEGAPGPWLPGGIDVLTQRRGDFAARLAGAIEDVWGCDPLPLLVVGMDTPQVMPSQLDAVA